MKAKTILVTVLGLCVLSGSAFTGQTIFLEAAYGSYASAEFPADGEVIMGDIAGANIWTKLIFVPGATAVEHTGYFSDDYSKVESRAQDANLGHPPYGSTPGWEYTFFAGNPAVGPADESLVRGTKYYWTVDETDAMGTTFPGEIWEFTIQDYKACCPNPPDGAVDIDTTVLLSWVPGFGVEEHDVYIGTNFDDVNNTVYDPMNQPPEFLVTVVESNYIVTGLSNNTTYYWRVDEVNHRMPPPIGGGMYYKGDVWSFTTRAEPNVFTGGVWTEPVPLTEVNTEYGEYSPFLSFDGLSLYFARGMNSSYYYLRIFEATRQQPYGPFTSVSQVLSSTNQHVFCPWVSPDNLRMYYFAQTENPILWQLKVSERASVNDPWSAGSDISELNQLGKVQAPTLTADELIIFFDSPDIPGEGGYDLWMASRPDMNSPFDEVTNLSELNTATNDGGPYVTSDGLTLLFHSNRNGPYQLFRATRQSLSEPFGNIEHLSAFDTPGGDSVSPNLSSDGSALYFTRQPGVDRSTRDIYVSYLINPNKASAPSPAHGATYVDPNVVLSWTPGMDALSHDVYFGTSNDDVNDADTLSEEYKGNYVVNIFDPCGLALETTYYWRIDEVTEPNAEPNIHKGDLWSFTTGSLPGQASNPSPADLATGVSTDAYLTWTAGSDATSHDVYFGTSSTPPFVTNQTTTTFAPPTMAFSTTYYWCIDEINKLGKTPGQVWSFTTRDVSYWELWTEPMPVTELNTEYADWNPFLSFDGLSLYFAIGRTPDYYYFRIFEATRQKPYGPFTSVNEILRSTSQHVFSPWVSTDYLRMYYFAQKESPILWQLKVSERASVNDSWPLGADISELNVLGKVAGSKLTADELIIFFASYDIPGGEGGYDIWMATRPDMNSPFDDITNLAEINTASNEVSPSVSPDGLTLIFQSNLNGDWQLFKATRPSLTEPFGDIEHLSVFDMPGYGPQHPFLSNDGSTLYFTRLIGNDKTTGDIYVSYLIDPNKASNPSPADGAKYVDPNVVLSWAPGEDALSHNVYFGTSFDDVNDANTLSDEYKGNYDVNSFDLSDLDPGTTYYWRIDEVSDSNNTSKGYVWDFTTKAFFILDPVSWWMFDEGLGATAHDSANDNDGTIYGATWTIGQIDGALSFDGLNDYVDMADTVKNYLDTTYSVSAWIKANTISYNKAILSYRHSTEGNPVLFALGQYYTNVDFAVRDNSHNLAQPSFVDAITANTWYHVAGVREANNVNVYVNGVSGIPDSATLGAISPDNLKIGATQWGGNPVSDHFNGAIDDVMIFDRALSEEEIWELYQSAFCEPGYPCINLLPETLEFFADEGGPDPAPQILSITNFGDDILNYQITEDCSWLQVDPNAGSSAGEPTEVTVTVDISGLDCGIYDCNLIIS
ncbi:MAG: LamG-like jellyroll fold domain-containing protein, partial [Planctomycetota bacterium]